MQNFNHLKIISETEKRIFVLRDQKIILDHDLAELYGVLTKRLNEQVKRNIERFPDDFMFQLKLNELDELVAICDRLKPLKHSSALPYAFTEQGVAMLSGVLKSERAIQVNITIMRVFVLARRLASSYQELLDKINELEIKYDGKNREQDKKIKAIFNTLNFLIRGAEEEERKEIGFKA